MGTEHSKQQCRQERDDPLCELAPPERAPGQGAAATDGTLLSAITEFAEEGSSRRSMSGVEPILHPADEAAEPGDGAGDAKAVVNAAGQQPPPPPPDPTFALRGSAASPSSSAGALVRALAGGAWDLALARLAKRPRDALATVKMEVYGTERRVLPLHLAIAVGAPAEVIQALLQADAGGEAVRTGTRNVVRERRKKRGKRGSFAGDGGKGGGSASKAKSDLRAEAASAPAAAAGGGSGGSKAPCAATHFGLGLASSRASNKLPSPPMPEDKPQPHPQPQPQPQPRSFPTSAGGTQRKSASQSVASSDGWLPLHLACLYRSPVEVVELLLRHHPGAAKIKSGYGLLPLHVVCAGLRCERLRRSEEEDDGSPSSDPELRGGGDGTAARDGWGAGDLPRAAELLLSAFPGSVHVPCSRPLHGNGWVPPGPSGETVGEPTCGVEHVQMTPVQYARRYLPDDAETRAVVEMLEGRRKVEGTISPSEGGEGSEGKRGGMVQSLRTADAGERRTRSRSLLKSVAAAAAVRLRSPLRSSRESSPSSPRGAAETMTPREDERPTKLYALISARDWSAASERLVRRPEEASVWTLVDGAAAEGAAAALLGRRGSRGSSNGLRVAAEEEEGEYACHRLPLHRACASKPPADLVKALVEAYPDGVRSREKFAMLPLHVACQRGASPSVITTLLSFYPGAARERDAFGLLPLHLACTEGCSLDVLSALLRSYPGAVEERDVPRRRPIDYVRESLHPNRDGMLRALGRDTNYWFAPSVQDDRSGEVPGLYFAIARKRWDEALERLRSDPATAGVWVIDANSDSGVSRHPRLPVHAACRRRAPPQVMRALLAAHPAGAAARGGKLDVLPLHIACQYGSDAGVVEELVRAHPEGASTADNFGLLPIHLAVTEGASPSIIRILLREYPDGTGSKDKRGNTPLVYAQASFHPHKAEVMELLKRDPGFWSSSTPPSAADEWRSDEVGGPSWLGGMPLLAQMLRW